MVHLDNTTLLGCSKEGCINGRGTERDLVVLARWRLCTANQALLAPRENCVPTSWSDNTEPAPDSMTYTN